MIPHLIPTVYKSKIPQGFSYPLGAEIISEALAGLPQYEQLSIRFSSYNLQRHFLLQKDIAKRLIHVLEITYYAESNRPWHITVSTLPSEHKHAAQEALKAVLPEVHHWLSSFTPEKLINRAKISYCYDLNTGQLSKQDNFK